MASVKGLATRESHTFVEPNMSIWTKEFSVRAYVRISWRSQWRAWAGGLRVGVDESVAKDAIVVW